MPGPYVGTTASSGTLALGVQSTFWDAYRRRRELSLAGPLSRIVQDAPAVSDVVKFAYFESSPIPSYMGRGRPISSKSFKDVGWTIPIYDWAKRVQWRQQDAEDDQTSSLMAQAQGVGEGYWVRDELNFFQIMSAGTDADGLPAIPNCADGVAFFSATDGAGAARFGVTGGNIVTGQTFTSGAGVRAGFFAGIQRILSYQDTESQPYVNPDAKNFLVFASVADTQVLTEAFAQNPSAQAPSTSTSNAGVQNALFAGGFNITVVPTQRVTTQNMYVFCLDVPTKPLIRANRKAPEETPLTTANNADAQNFYIEGLQWKSRTGYGAGLPIGSAKVST